MTDLHTLLAAGAEDGGTAYPPGEHFYERAERAVRARRTRNATLGGVAASLVALGGAGAVGGWLPGLAGLNRGPGPVVAGRLTPVAAAPDCVRDLLGRANARYVDDQLVGAVVDIPAAKRTITHGLTRGSGWDAGVVDVLGGPAAARPTGASAVVWDGVTPAVDLAAGRHFVLLFLDNSPRVPGGTYDGPVWGYVADLTWPVSGDGMTVTCADGRFAVVPWRDATAAGGWLGAGAPKVTPSFGGPAGASTVSPTSASTVSPGAGSVSSTA